MIKKEQVHNKIDKVKSEAGEFYHFMTKVENIKHKEERSYSLKQWDEYNNMAGSYSGGSYSEGSYSQYKPMAITCEVYEDEE